MRKTQSQACARTSHREMVRGVKTKEVERLYVTQNDFETTVDIGTMYVGGKSALAL